MTQSRCRLGAALAYPCFALAAIVLFAALAVGAEAASVPNLTVSGPTSASPDVPGTPTHNYPFFASNHNLPAHGYVEQEFYIEGTANRYNTPVIGDPVTVVDGGHAYRTRILVRRPADPKQFNASRSTTPRT